MWTLCNRPLFAASNCTVTNALRAETLILEIIITHPNAYKMQNKAGAEAEPYIPYSENMHHIRIRPADIHNYMK
jgi:hypothetical protein